ncbi:hypothetical protein [Glycomyces terrestris]|nr:hypothetical protein [Glycomyces terrestris]
MTFERHDQAGFDRPFDLDATSVFLLLRALPSTSEISPRRRSATARFGD